MLCGLKPGWYVSAFMMRGGPAPRFRGLWRAPTRYALAIPRKQPMSQHHPRRSQVPPEPKSDGMQHIPRALDVRCGHWGGAPRARGAPWGGAGPISITFNGRVTLVPIYFFRSGAFQNFVYNTSMAVHELIYGPVGTNSPLRPSPAKNFVKLIVRPGNPGEPGGEHLWYIFLPVIALMAQTRYHSVYVPRFLLQNRCTAPH